MTRKCWCESKIKDGAQLRGTPRDRIRFTCQKKNQAFRINLGVSDQRDRGGGRGDNKGRRLVSGQEAPREKTDERVPRQQSKADCKGEMQTRAVWGNFRRGKGRVGMEYWQEEKVTS